MLKENFGYGDGDCTLRLSKDGGIENDVIINVSQNSNNSDTLSFITLNRRQYTAPPFSSVNYDLNLCTGLFDFFEDVFSNRYSFMYSSLTVEAWLTALHDAEKTFLEKHGLTFMDYYGTVDESVKEYVEHKSEIRAKYPKESPIYGEYGIIYEAMDATYKKCDIISNDGYLAEISPILMNTFKNTLGSMLVEHFAGICVATPPNGEPRILMERSIGLPMVLRSKCFMPILFDMLIEPLICKDGISLFDLADTEFDVWSVNSETSISEVMGLCDESGILTIPYKEKGFSDFPHLFGNFEYKYLYRENELYKEGFAASIG